MSRPQLRPPGPTDPHGLIRYLRSELSAWRARRSHAQQSTWEAVTEADRGKFELEYERAHERVRSIEEQLFGLGVES